MKREAFIWAPIYVIVGFFLFQLVLQQRDDAREVARVAALPAADDLFSLTFVRLACEDDRLLVYTDATVLEAFSGRYLVVLKNGETGRNFHTPEWSDWFPYEPGPDGGVNYKQPEDLEWWSNIDPLPHDLTCDVPVVMQTCWEARLGADQLEPAICFTANYEPGRQEELSE